MSLELLRHERVARITAESVNIDLEDPLAQEALVQLQEIIETPGSMIDSGGAGKVYRLASGACMKVLDQRHEAGQYNRGNTLTEEARFNQFLSTFSHKGVRSPRYIGRINARAPQLMEALLMEELHAVNLQYVLNGDAELPTNFDIDIFMKGFSSYITQLNDQLGIAHNDLEARNVMIDQETGSARIIDFGRSLWLRNMNDDERKKKTNEDWCNVVKIEKQLEGHVASLTMKE